MGLRDLQTRCALFAHRRLHLLKKYSKLAWQRLKNPRKKKAPSKVGMINGLVIAAAKKLNLQVEELPDEFLRITDGEKVIYSRDFDFSFESLTAYWLCGDKHMTSLLLRQAGLPVPDFAVVEARQLAKAFAEFPQVEPPLVVKPCFGAGGQGITIGVKTLAEFRKACYHAATSCDRLIVEKVAEGRHWRINMFDGEVISASERLPAFVIGDGKTTIAGLIDRKNGGIVVRNGFPNAYPIRLDVETQAVLAEQNLSPSSVLPDGTKVVLKRICNASAGGVTVDISRQVHPDYLKLARDSAAAMGARFVGVDIIAPDLMAPMHSSCMINEVNTTPGLEMANFDASGNGDASESVVRLISLIFGKETWPTYPADASYANQSRELVSV